MAKSKGLDPKETTKALKDLNKELEDTVDVVITKNNTLNGHKMQKDAIVSVTSENAEKLVKDGKAKLKE